MTFINADMLWLLVGVLFLWVVLSFRISKATNPLFTPEIFEKLLKNKSALHPQIRVALFMLALISMVIALAQPVTEKEKIKIDEQAIDIIVALDISRSMEAKDLYPNRLVWAKKKLSDFLESSDGMRTGVMAFAQNSFVVVPITADKEVANYLVNNLDNDSITEKGTNFEQLIDSAAEQLKDRLHKYLLIISDGGDEKSYDKEVALAKERGLTLFVLGTATEKGAPVLDENGGFIKRNSEIILTQLNSAVKAFALQTGGSYIESIASNDDVKAMLHEIRSKAEKEHIASREIKNYIHYFVYFLIAASALLLYAFSSLPVRHRSQALALFTLMMFSFMPTPSHAGVLDFFTIDAALQAYKQNDYNKSISKLETLDSHSDELNYDKANAYYKQKVYDKAIELYEKIETNGTLKQKALHNLGNAYAYSQKLQEAVEAYERSLQLGDDSQTRENLEKVKKLLDEQKKQDEKKQKDDNKEDDKQNKNSEQNKEQERKEQEQDQQKKDQESDSNKQNEQKAKKEQQKEQEKREETPQKGEKNKAQEPQPQQSQKELSDKQERKLMELLNQQKGNTYRYQINRPQQKEQYDKPW